MWLARGREHAPGHCNIGAVYRPFLILSPRESPPMCPSWKTPKRVRRTLDNGQVRLTAVQRNRVARRTKTRAQLAALSRGCVHTYKYNIYIYLHIKSTCVYMCVCVCLFVFVFVWTISHLMTCGFFTVRYHLGVVIRDSRG